MRHKGHAVKVVPATPEFIAEAARRLREGAIIAYPTDTVYAVGADATNPRAIERVRALKGRAPAKPLIVLSASRAEAEAYGEFDAPARQLAEAFWPGALTLVLARREPSALASEVSAGSATVALRVPGNVATLALLMATGRPLVAPSANREGEPTRSSAWGVGRAFGSALALVLDGGPSRDAAPSTLLDLTHSPPRLLREGAVSRQALEAIVGPIASCA